MILVSLATITDQVNKLVELLSIASPYARASYRAKKHPHVIICGSMTLKTIHDFLEEFCHPDHGHQDTKVVIMGNTVPSQDLLAMLASPDYSLRVKYLEGSVLVDSDLARADVTKSICTWIFCDKNATDAFAEDSDNIMRAITIKKYVSAQTAGSKASIVLQLLCSDNRHQLTVSACGASNCQVICLDEMKMNLLGKSCICPGFSTMICNLMISASAARGTAFEEWFKEYTSGCGQEIYCTNISPKLAGRSFSEVVVLLYRERGCLLFAIEIVDNKGFSRVVLNPAAYIIPDTCPKVFLIAQDSEDADDVRDFGLDKETIEALQDQDSEEEDQEDDLVAAYKQHRRSHAKYPPDLSKMARSTQIKARLQKSTHITEPQLLSNAICETVEHIQGHVLVCGCPSSIPIFVHTLRPKYIQAEELMPIVFLHTVPPTESVWAEVSQYPEVYVVLGSPLETRDLVRAGVLTLSRAIILSSGSDSSDGSKEAEGYLADADALFTYQSIAKVRPGVPIVCEIDNGGNVSFLCGDEQGKGQEEEDEDGEFSDFTLLGPFAAGAVYVDSLQDKLAVQAYYNPNLLRVIRELVVGQAEEETYQEPNVTPSHLTCTPVPARFHGKSYIQLFQYLISKQMQIPLGLYRSSPWGIPRGDNLPYVITNPTADILCQADDFVYTLDSKLAGDTTLEVKVLRARNLGPFGRPGVEGYACNIEVAGGSLSTPVMSGTSPIWECPPFTFCVHEDPWPLTVSCSIMGHGRRLEGGKDTPNKIKVGVGELVVSDEKDLGDTYTKKVWVDLEHYRAPKQQDADEDDEIEWKRASSDVDRRPAVYLQLSYTFPEWEGVPTEEAEKFHANSEKGRREMIGASVHHSASFRQSKTSVEPAPNHDPEEPLNAPPEETLHNGDKNEVPDRDVQARTDLALSDDVVEQHHVRDHDEHELRHDPYTAHDPYDIRMHAYQNGSHREEHHLKYPTPDQYQKLNDRRLSMAADMRNLVRREEVQAEHHLRPDLFQLESANGQRSEMSPRALPALQTVSGRPRRKKGRPGNGHTDASSVASGGSAAESVTRSHASRSDARRAAVERIDSALSSGDFSSQAIFTRSNGMASRSSLNGTGLTVSMRKPSESSSARKAAHPPSAAAHMQHGNSGRNFLGQAGAETVIVSQLQDRDSPVPSQHSVPGAENGSPRDRRTSRQGSVRNQMQGSSMPMGPAR